MIPATGRVEADLLATEDQEKLVRAIRNLFPEAGLDKKGGKLAGGVQLAHFSELLERQRIRDAVRAILDENERNGCSFIDLDKLAAAAGKIAAAEGPPNGKIRLFLDWKKA